jgi:hypothetical protein
MITQTNERDNQHPSAQSAALAMDLKLDEKQQIWSVRGGCVGFSNQAHDTFETISWVRLKRYRSGTVTLYRVQHFGRCGDWLNNA